MKKKFGFATKNTELLTEMFKKVYFLYYEDAMYVVKSTTVLYLSQFLVDPYDIWYKSRATQRALTRQISSCSEEK